MAVLHVHSLYQNNPDLAKVQHAIRTGNVPVLRYYRFWAQSEIAAVCAITAFVGACGEQVHGQTPACGAKQRERVDSSQCSSFSTRDGVRTDHEQRPGTHDGEQGRV